MRQPPVNRIADDAIKAWKITAAIAAGVLWFITIALFVFAYLLDFTYWIGAAGILISALCTYLFVFLLPKLRWRRWRYEVFEQEIYIQHGILIVSRTLVPMIRVQHVDTKQGPILKIISWRVFRFLLQQQRMKFLHCLKRMRRNSGTEFQHWQGWMRMMFEAKRLHPAAILFNLIKTVREFLFAIIIGFITFRDDSLLYFVLITSGFLIIFIAASILTWYRYSYRIEDDELRIEYGVFIRKTLYFQNRIQSIDLTSGVIHRIFGLTKVQIETAGTGTSAEASLSAVTLAEGEALREELKTGGTKQTYDENTTDEPAEQTKPSTTISFKRLFIAGTTSGSVGVIFALAAAGFSELEQFIPDSFYDNTLEWAIGLGIVILIVMGIVALLLLWLLGIAGTMIKYGNFTITKSDDELFITRGLLEKNN